MEELKEVLIEDWLYLANYKLLSGIWETLEVLQGIEHSFNLIYLICNMTFSVIITTKICKYFKDKK